MSAQGWQLTEIKRTKYTFKSCQPNKYHYRLDYLDGNKKKNQEYLNFLQSLGIKIVAYTSNWVYLVKENKKNDHESFELFSDNQSRINFLNKLMNIGIVFIIGPILSFIAFLISGLSNPILMPLLLASFGCVPLIILFLSGLSEINKKIKTLKKEQIISE